VYPVSSTESGAPPLVPSIGVWPALYSGGESEIVSVLKMPFISRKSSETWSLGAVVRSLMKFLIERIMGGQSSSLGSHQSEGLMPHPSSIRLRKTLE
jgi:hypothetical protein